MGPFLPKGNIVIILQISECFFLDWHFEQKMTRILEDVYDRVLIEQMAQY